MASGYPRAGSSGCQLRRSCQPRDWVMLSFRSSTSASLHQSGYLKGSALWEKNRFIRWCKEAHVQQNHSPNLNVPVPAPQVRGSKAALPCEFSTLNPGLPVWISPRDSFEVGAGRGLLRKQTAEGRQHRVTNPLRYRSKKPGRDALGQEQVRSRPCCRPSGPRRCSHLPPGSFPAPLSRAPPAGGPPTSGVQAAGSTSVVPTQGHILSPLASPSASWTGPGFAPSDPPCSFHCGDTPATCPSPSQGTQVGSAAVSARTTGAVPPTPSSLVPSPFSSCGSPATLLRPISGTPDVGFQPGPPSATPDGLSNMGRRPSLSPRFASRESPFPPTCAHMHPHTHIPQRHTDTLPPAHTHPHEHQHATQPFHVHSLTCTHTLGDGGSAALPGHTGYSGCGGREAGGT
ncbi:leucine-rich repeat extensin-like protein 5 isoform X1 [Canis lupus familiaris]|uniref:leucine-rich repeat extensin-like protein 5 isoform X1 n=1 Tax=Canis lupus familiaris TaxID=9615 RepID=UPI0015F1511C|nr:leucine-rich repeat extensin-like protein 5 isoform X1 [Canis lupus familiaris]